jgi:peroxiredoxin
MKLRLETQLIKTLYSVIITGIISTLMIQAKAEEYRIAIEWQGLKDTSVYLASYYDTKIYVKDSLRLDTKGKGVFKGNKELQQGLYVLYLNDKTYFDVLIGADKDFTIKTNQTDIRKNLSITGAAESEKFLHYQNYITTMGEKRQKLVDIANDTINKNKAKIREDLKAIDDEFNQHLDSEIKSMPGSMYALFLKAVKPLPVPVIPVERSHPKYDSIAWFTDYLHKSNHFFDDIDFTDERLLNTPLLQPKLEAFFNKILLQIPDTIAKYSMQVINRAKPNRTMFQYTTQYLLNNSVQNKIMGMDKVLLTIAENVYLKGDAFWADSTIMARLKEEVFFTRLNLIGQQAQDLILRDTTGGYLSLHEINADYLIVVFWDPTCGHCKKDIPALYNEVYLKLLQHHVEVLSVYNGTDKQQWLDFVNEHEFAGWIHAWDPDRTSGYQYKYDVRETPRIFLLDKNKKIIAKKIDNKNLIKIIETFVKEI